MSSTYLEHLIFTALLICTENTFWDRDITSTRDSDDIFVESFRKSFTLYVESGMSRMVEIDIDMLRREQGVTEDFKAKFYKFIVDHYLPQPGESQSRASEESAGGELGASDSGPGGQVVEPELEQKNKKKFTWLQKLKLKFHRDKGHDGA